MISTFMGHDVLLRTVSWNAVGLVDLEVAKWTEIEPDLASTELGLQYVNPDPELQECLFYI